MAKYLDENGLKTLADNINGKFIPYTGAKKDINIGSHVFTVGDVNTVYTQTAPGSISLKNPLGTLSIGTYSLSVNGTTIYWPTVSADPNGKYFALKSDIPANIKDGTGNGSLNQIKDGTGTTFSIDDSSGNSKNPNAYALDNTIKGDIVFGGVGDYSTSLGGKSSAQGKRSVAQGTTTIAKGNYSHAEGDNSVALGPDSHAEGYATVTYGKASHSEGTSTQALGEGSHAEGSNTKATKTGAHSEGEETDASGYASHTEGLFNKVLSEIPADTGGSGSGITPPPSTGWNIEEHRGDAGHAEGYGNVVYGFASHAEGHQNKSSGHYSHSEGLLNTASGNYSHAEGTGCLASGTGAHAGGSYCYAITSNAFAHGQSLTTNIPNQAVLGEYNLDLPFSSRETQYLFAIGNGTDVNHRSNAFVSYKDGRAAIGKDPVNDFDVATKGYVDRGIGVKQDKITPTNKLPVSNVSGLASVATSGSYNDLSNKPAIGDLVPYTGATKDVNIGNHGILMGEPTGTLLTLDPSTITFSLGGESQDMLYIDARTVTISNDNAGDSIYWPGAIGSTAAGAKVFALTSDITSHAGIDKVGTVTKVNGTSPDSSGNVQLNIPTANNGLLTIQRNGANVATFRANQSGDTLANISVPTELAQLGGRTFSNITSRGEEYLEWGGPAKVGDVSPIGTAMSSEHNANRIAFINPDALKVEYSSDGGSTWTDYPITGDGTEQKTRLCTKNADYRIGRPDNSTNLIANKSKTRITITGTDGKKQYVYSALKKMLINVSTASALSLLVERRTGANYESNGAWETVGTYQLAGWSGWNDIPLNFALGGGLNQKSNYWQMRLTITCTTVNSNYPKEAAVLGLRLFGTTSWFPPSTLAETGHLYSFDMSQNAIFPAVVSATTFMENNEALSNKYLGKTAQAADSAKLNGQPSSHYLTSIKINGTTKPSTNSTVDLGTVLTSHQSLSGYMKVVSNSNGVMTITY